MNPGSLWATAKALNRNSLPAGSSVGYLEVGGTKPSLEAFVDYAKQFA